MFEMIQIRIAPSGLGLLRTLSMNSFVLILITSFFLATGSAHGQAKSSDANGAQTTQTKGAQPKQAAAKTDPKTAAKTDAKASGGQGAIKTASMSLAALNFSCSESDVSVYIDGQIIGPLPMPGPWAIQAGAHQVEFRAKDRVVKSVKILAKSGQNEEVSCTGAKPTLTAYEQDALTRYRWAPLTTSDIGFGVAVAGLVAVGVGVWYGLESKDLSDQATQMRIRETYRRDFERLADMSEDSALTANLSYGIGAAALIAGMAMAFFGEGGLFAVSSDQEATGVSLRGEF